MRNRLSIAAILAAVAASGAAHATTQTFVFSGPGVPSQGNYIYAPTVPGASFTGESGLESDSSAWGFPPSPDGQVAAFIQHYYDQPDGSLSVTFENLAENDQLALSFSAVNRPNSPLLDFTVSDGVTSYKIDQLPTDSWTKETLDFVATGPSATFTFAVLNGNGVDSAVAIDDITLNSALTVPPANTNPVFIPIGPSQPLPAVGGPLDQPVTPTGSAAPEPATWAMMGFGFAFLRYASFRASRKPAAAAA